MTALWVFTFKLLNYDFGITVDGSGPMTSFWWSLDGSYGPTPTNGEFQRSRALQFAFALPYWIAAGLFAIVAMTTVNSAL